MRSLPYCPLPSTSFVKDWYAPATNIELSGLEVSLVNVMSRELVLRSYIEQVRDRYSYILIDCMPSLDMITINAFACADSILIPVQAAYLPVKGLEQLIKTIDKVKRQINPKLDIEGFRVLTPHTSRCSPWFPPFFHHQGHGTGVP
mgnify:CR=1 FL=1